MNVHIKEANTIYKTGYEFLHWNTKPDDSGEILESGKDYGTDGTQNRILYAIWKCPLSNIRHTRTGDMSDVFNVNEFIVEWDEPSDVNFDHILVTIKVTDYWYADGTYIDNVSINKDIRYYTFSHNWFMVSWFIVELRTVDEYGIPSSALRYTIRKE
jgi:hypothetical protein